MIVSINDGGHMDTKVAGLEDGRRRRRQQAAETPWARERVRIGRCMLAERDAGWANPIVAIRAPCSTAPAGSKIPSFDHEGSGRENIRVAMAAVDARLRFAGRLRNIRRHYAATHRKEPCQLPHSRYGSL